MVGSKQEDVVTSRSVIVGMVVALAVAVSTGSVLLVGSGFAAASLLLVIGVLVRKAIGPQVSSWLLPSSRISWVHTNEREAA
jgi:hypothetical protein